MLSHLRFHRRGPPSAPVSPAFDQQSPSPLSSHQSPLSPDTVSPLEGQPLSSASSQPPTLPPIARVTSTELSARFDLRFDVENATQTEPRAPKSPYNAPYNALYNAPYHADSGFIGGVALQKYRRGLEAQHAVGRSDHQDDRGSFEDQNQHQGRPRPISTNTDLPLRPPPQTSSYGKPTVTYGKPIDLQSSAAATGGQRPATTRLVTEPSPSLASTTVIEPQKGKKTLPFLKNPMSTLLLRRKAAQAAPALPPLPLAGRVEEPTYDPRIRGTRFHDFSAPRPRTTISHQDNVAPRSSSRPSVSSDKGSRPTQENTRDNADQTRQLSNSGSARSESLSIVSPPLANSSSVSSCRTKSSAVDQLVPLDSYSAPPVPPKDEVSQVSWQASPSEQFEAGTPNPVIVPKSIDSIRVNRSRNVSLSSIPRHMKSTSSRFSFDMTGAAKQEKILEERHRQRELDKKAATGEVRDSRYDDFDDDAFDYDAMMDDDGLEERIPGVNADYDEDNYFEEDIPEVNDDYDDGYFEEEIPGVNSDLHDEDHPRIHDPCFAEDTDPDNDQENFAGFVFQRSNPTSSLASPRTCGLIATPRDADGKVIGFAMTQDASEAEATFPPTPEPEYPLSAHQHTTEVSSLGSEEVGGVGSLPLTQVDDNVISHDSSLQQADLRQSHTNDDLYFDGGMMGYAEEFADDLAAEPEYDSVPFDESIFDNNDTDQYGRPVPGAFAQAQSLRRAMVQGEPSKPEAVIRESGMTSRLSARSGASHSTAHTSLSIDHQQTFHEEAPKAAHVSTMDSTTAILSPRPIDARDDPMAAYQAALAAAAHEAEASGKFQRLSFPPPDANPDHSANDYSEAYTSDSYDDDNIFSYENMNDFELDDDAIIAEANASALANDSDGWYGQEFGFYAAPVNQHHGPQVSASSSVDELEYSHGGFFGPKGAGGVNRTISGRVISREQNLTPITERSEYSNRNSIMSLGMPPFTSGTPTIQSPGLAQLVMMADRGDDHMTLSALLRLRSRAWGGSQASLASSKDGSPRSERGEVPNSPWTTSFSGGGASVPATQGQARNNSVYSTVSHSSEPGSGPGSPTLTMAMPLMLGSQSDHYASFQAGFQPSTNIVTEPLTSELHQLQTSDVAYRDSYDTPLSALSRGNSHEWNGSQDTNAPPKTSRRPGKGHQRQKSSTDSISYTMREEDSGETRWVMERRRTGESGRVEILEREVVEGGRI